MSKKKTISWQPFLLIVLVALLSLSLLQPNPLLVLAQSTNLLTNGDIESGTSGWGVFGSGTLSASTNPVHGGAQSLLLTARTASWNGISQNVTSRLTNGRTYTTNVWMRTQSGTPTGKVTLALTANGTTSYLALAQGAVNSSGWTLLSGTATVSWSGALSSATFYVETTSSTDSFYIDDASFSDNAGPTSTPTPTGTPNTGAVSINAGGPANGSFSADAYFSGGSTYTNTASIDTSQVGSVPAAIFNTERYGAMTYTIPNRSGAQTVTLYFAENFWTAAGQRTFNVSINGTTVLSNFDIFVAAGGANRAIAQTFNTTANSSGQVVIQFSAVVENPKISGIVVAGGSANTFTLSYTKAGTGGGTVTSSPAGINCTSNCSATFPANSSVTLTAQPASGSTFAGWSGACSGTGNCTITMDTNKTVTATFNGSNPTTFNNPVLWEDLADIDIIRVGNVYYYSASTMHYSPGAPILRSYDLVNWEFAGHSVPTLDFGSNAYNLSGGRAYVKGIWASTLGYRNSNSTFYWIGCIEFNRTYVYTASAVNGTWQKRSQINNCYYDAGLLIDDNDTMYVAYGNTQISVAQLSADGFSQVRAQQVYSTPSSIGTLEGSRFYKRNGSYYIFLTRPANGQYILKSSSPWGPYEIRQLLLDLPGPISGGGVPHQGGLVQTQNGDWYYMAFVDSYPGGRVPVLAPITWSADGWPSLQLVSGRWGATYPFPNLPYTPLKSPTGTDTFSGTALGPEWEWNHNPDTTRFSVNNRLTLQTATVTNDLYNARNTLSHRILGPTSTATIVLNYGNMRDGDRAGLALLRDSSAWIGIKRDNGQNRVVFTNGLTMDSNWNTTGTGTEVASAAISGGRIWLRIAADIRPGTGRQGRFYYSTDGTNFTQLGTFTMGNAWQFFMGYRYAIFNYATQALGGSVTVDSFTMTTP